MSITGTTIARNVADTGLGGGIVSGGRLTIPVSRLRPHRAGSPVNTHNDGGAGPGVGHIRGARGDEQSA
jgi:hypothetical protein